METVFPTSTPAMIEELQTTNESLRNSLTVERNRIANLESRIDSMIERLMHHVENNNIDSEVAEDLAEYFGRDLTRTVMVRVTADIDIEVTIPVGYDIDDLHGDLEVEITNSYSSDVEIQSYETAGIQVEEM